MNGTGQFRASQVTHLRPGLEIDPSSQIGGLTDVRQRLNIGISSDNNIWRVFMFGGKRKRLVRHVTDALNPFVMNTQRATGIPQGFWEDDFVLGFIGFCIAFHMNKTSNINASVSDKGAALIEVFTNLSHMNGLPLARKYNTLTIDKSNPEFESGADNAATWLFYMYGFLKNEATNRDVLLASNNGEISDREIVAVKLLDQLYFEKIRKLSE